MLDWLRGNALLLVVGALLIGLLVFKTDDKGAIAHASSKDRRKAWKTWEFVWSMTELDAWTWKGPEKYMYYIKDKRTNLCFAVATPMGQGGFMASVPCEKVEQYIEDTDASARSYKKKKGM